MDSRLLFVALIYSLQHHYRVRVMFASDEYGNPPLGNNVPSYLESTGSKAEAALKSARLGFQARLDFLHNDIGQSSSDGFICSL